MSTRGAYGFRINDKDKVTYNHFDSYPDGLGSTIVEFIRTTSDEQLNEIANRIRLVDEDDKPTPEDVKKYQHLFQEVGTQDPRDWYALLRSAQGELKFYRDNGLDVMLDSATFLQDSLFCEFAYVINMDTGMLEFYEGLQKEKCRGRYGDKKTDDDNKYYGVKLVTETPLDEVRAGVDPFPEEEDDE